MKVNDVMIENVSFCRENETLGKAAELMWQKDCGMVPVLNDEDEIIGVVTDRDICIAVASRNQLPSDISVKDLADGKVITCSKKHSVKKVLKIMKKHQIKRLPVVGNNGKICGVVSINDMLQMRKSKRYKKQIIKTLTAIGRPSPILLEEV